MNNEQGWYEFMSGLTGALLAGLLAMWLFGLGGCASGVVPEYKPGQAEALQTTLDYFGGGLRAVDVPPIIWHNAEELNCQAPGDAGPTGWLRDGVCVGGLYFADSALQGPAWLELAWPAGNVKFSTIDMTHELCHFWHDRIKHDPDQSHQSECFYGVIDEHYDPRSLEYQAQAKLAELGM